MPIKNWTKHIYVVGDACVFEKILRGVAHCSDGLPIQLMFATVIALCECVRWVCLFWAFACFSSFYFSYLKWVWFRQIGSIAAIRCASWTSCGSDWQRPYTIRKSGRSSSMCIWRKRNQFRTKKMCVPSSHFRCVSFPFFHSLPFYLFCFVCFGSIGFKMLFPNHRL